MQQLLKILFVCFVFLISGNALAKKALTTVIVKNLQSTYDGRTVRLTADIDYIKDGEHFSCTVKNKKVRWGGTLTEGILISLCDDGRQFYPSARLSSSMEDPNIDIFIQESSNFVDQTITDLPLTSINRIVTPLNKARKIIPLVVEKFEGTYEDQTGTVSGTVRYNVNDKSFVCSWHDQQLSWPSKVEIEDLKKVISGLKISAEMKAILVTERSMLKTLSSVKLCDDGREYIPMFYVSNNNNHPQLELEITSNEPRNMYDYVSQKISWADLLYPYANTGDKS
jgi:hypothetical protein